VTGWFSTEVADREYRAGWERGRDDGSRLEADLIVTIDDLEKLLADPAHPGQLEGKVRARELSQHDLEVTQGIFRLFEPDRGQVETWNTRYRMDLLSQEGRRYQLEAIKMFHDDPGLDAWKDTTTAFVRILEGGKAFGAGILRISLAKLIRELRNPDSAP
jgi:cholesterol oxidase